MRPVQFGLWYDFRQALPHSLDYARYYAECLDEIEAGEALGFSHVWLSEHHLVEDGYCPAPLVAAGAIAGRTRHLQIGTNIVLLPLYHPLRLAEDVAVLDLVSGGRFTLGVGAGYVQFEFENFGVERRYRPSYMEEGTAILRQCWDEGRVDYQGKRYAFGPRPFSPQPGRRIPIYWGANAEAAVRRAARLGDGFLTTAPRGFAAARQHYNWVQDELHAHGQKQFPFVVSAWVYVHEDSEQAFRDAAPAIAYQQSKYADWGTDRENPRPAALNAANLPRNEFPLIGNPEEIARQLLSLYADVPFDQLCFWGRLPGLNHAQALNSMQLFMEEVVPIFQAQRRS
jgi:alkanesulfonate monooxygenase SsuD/methylene tetrahydromethanopterin reductase-like flavin-dependent oxidoreductase (luciferase family)